MRVYLSCPSSHLLLAQEAMQKLRKAGHTITHDWTALMEREPAMSVEELGYCGCADVDAVIDAEALVCVITSRGGPSCGCAVEVGAAFAAGRTVTYVELVEMDDGPWERHPFRWHAHARVGSIDEALDVLARFGRP